MPNVALVDFTGGIGDGIVIDEQTKSGTLFRQIHKMLTRKTILTACILTKESRNGLAGGHAYSVTDVKQVIVWDCRHFEKCYAYYFIHVYIIKM